MFFPLNYKRIHTKNYHIFTKKINKIFFFILDKNDFWRKKKNNYWKKQFPFLTINKNIAYFDGAATQLKPQIVIDEINKYYQKYSVNIHNENNNFLFLKVKKVVTETRKMIIQIINGNSPEEVVFFSSATHAFNFLALMYKKHLKKDDKIALTYLEHSSNCFSWLSITKNINKVVFLSLNRENEIDLEKLEKINKKIKVVSISQTSNSLGVIQPLAKIIDLIKKKILTV